MTTPSTAGRTAWSPTMRRRLRRGVADERAGALVLLVAAASALVWANLAPGSYTALWTTEFSVRIGDHAASEDLKTWVNGGLMTLFFFVVGLEARRELDLGELRTRRRLVLPLLAGLAGMAVPVILYLTLTRGTPAAHGWGMVMSTDTALALGLLAVVGVRSAALRSFLIAVLVVDDLAALAVIATVYTEHVVPAALLVAVGFVVAVLIARRAGLRAVPVYVVLGLGTWAALLASGLDPVVAGLVLGLLTLAYPAARRDLESATDLVRAFREQPTAELARVARIGVGAAISPNERLHRAVLPWVTLGVVPLFALANTGVPLGGGVLARALSSPVTLAVVIGYGLGKPLGIVGTALLLTGASRGRLRPPVGWAGVTGCGTIAGIGFTVALLIASLAFTGPALEDATLGVLASALVAPALTWLVFRVLTLLPARRRERALLGSTPVLIDLVDPVDPQRDHVRGPAQAPVTVLEYGDFECPYCGQAEPTVRELLAERGDVRYAWRHLPLPDVHPHATIAAQAAEAAARQGAFWPMHDRLLEHQDTLRPADLDRHAAALGLDPDTFRRDVHAIETIERVAADVDSADHSAVAGTPTFFVNGRRHHGAYDLDSLLHEIDLAHTRTNLEV